MLEPDELEAIACIVKHHRKKGNPLEDPSCPQDMRVALLAGILKIGDALDRTLRQSVLEVKATVN